MSFELLSTGELLVDLIGVKSEPEAAQGQYLYSREAGGAPGNVATAAARLLGRGRVAFVGRVGDDSLGRFLRATIESSGVDVSNLTLSSDVQTPIAVVAQPEGSQEVEFSFYGPDQGKRLALVTPDDLPVRTLKECRIVYAGGVALSHQVSAESVRLAGRYTSEGGSLFAFDPNWRPALWPGPDPWKSAVWSLLHDIDVLKLSLTELTLLGGISDPTRGGATIAQIAAKDRQASRPLLLAITLGAQGVAYLLYSGPDEGSRLIAEGKVDPIPVNAIDPTGAGDAFFAGLLVGLLEAADREGITGRIDLAALSADGLLGAMRLGNATGALTTTRRGAMSGQPSRADVEKILGQPPPNPID